MSKSGFKPPQLKERSKWYNFLFHLSHFAFHFMFIFNHDIFLVCFISSIDRIFVYKRSTSFHNFVKVVLTKNPKKRPTAEKLLEVLNADVKL